MVMIGLKSTWICLLLCWGSSFPSIRWSLCPAWHQRHPHSSQAALTPLNWKNILILFWDQSFQPREILLLMSIYSLQWSGLFPFLSRSHQLLQLAVGLVLDTCLTPLGGVSSMATWMFHHVFISVFGLPKNITVFAATSMSCQGFQYSPRFIFLLSSYISVFSPGIPKLALWGFFHTCLLALFPWHRKSCSQYKLEPWQEMTKVEMFPVWQPVDLPPVHVSHFCLVFW